MSRIIKFKLWTFTPNINITNGLQNGSMIDIMIVKDSILVKLLYINKIEFKKFCTKLSVSYFLMNFFNNVKNIGHFLSHNVLKILIFH
jgi:hypothetical protein